MLLPDGGSSIKQIIVEIDGLQQVADQLRTDLEAAFRTQVPKVYDAMEPGASLGGNIVGSAWARLQDSLHASLQGTADALQQLDLGTQAVSQAAEMIARDYGDSDAFARAQVTDVNNILVAPPPESLDRLNSTIPAGEQP